jgi:hypothetical protein
MMPAIPFLYIWVGRVGKAFEAGNLRNRTRLILRGFVSFSTSLFLMSSLLQLPNAIGFFSFLIGGPQYGMNHLLSSNVDWGQHLFEVEKWAVSHPEHQPLYVDLTSGFDEKDFSPLQTPKIGSKLLPGFYAVSIEKFLRSPRYQGLGDGDIIATIQHAVYVVEMK